MGTLRKCVGLVLVTCFLMPLIVLQPVDGQGQSNEIIISPDGSVSGTDTILQNGNTYFLTKNLRASITIEKDDVVFDGAGFSLIGLGNITYHTDIEMYEFGGFENQTAIFLQNGDNVTIRNVIIQNFGIGLTLYNSTYCTVSDNKLDSNFWGIFANCSSSNWIHDNEISSPTPFLNQRGVYTINCNNTVIAENKLEGSSFISGSNNQFLANNADDLTVESLNNLISSNNLTSVSLLGNSTNNLFTRNVINGASIGIIFTDPKYPELDFNNSFIYNTISNHCESATWGFNANKHGLFYQNNFINNGWNVFDGTGNHPLPTNYPAQLVPDHNWDNGTYGNYWSNYKSLYPNATYVGNTGTYDTPYAVTPLTSYRYLFYDYCPLVNPVTFSQIITDSSPWASTAIANPNKVSEFSWLVIVPLLLSIFCITVLLRQRKTVNLTFSQAST